MKHREQNDALKEGNKIAVQRYQFAIKCLGELPKLVVDISCGFGYGSYLIREAGHNVIGIDNSQAAIDYARENYPGNYFVWDVEKIELSPFDVGVCLEALSHFKDPEAFINKLKVKELLISAPIDPDPNDGYFFRRHNLSERQFKDMLKDWKIVDEFWQKTKHNKYLTIYARKYDENTIL